MVNNCTSLFCPFHYRLGGDATVPGRDVTRKKKRRDVTGRKKRRDVTGVLETLGRRPFRARLQVRELESERVRELESERARE